MRLAALLVLAASVPVAAAPCSVRVTSAPDGVREVIEHWVSAEPRCRAAVEVEIVETEGGLHVIARDDRGRERDRIVPDAQTAGVLIASWAADDTVALPPPAARVTLAPPSLARATAVDARPWPFAAGDRRWIRLAFVDGLATAMLSTGNNVTEPASSHGLRGSAGVWNHGAWTLDASFEVVASHPVVFSRPMGDLKIDEYTAVASFGYELRSGQVSLTPSIGLGARYATFFYSENAAHTFDERGMMVVEQAAVLVAVDVTAHAQLTLGTSVVFHPDPWNVRENMELVGLGGLGWAM